MADAEVNTGVNTDVTSDRSGVTSTKSGADSDKSGVSSDKRGAGGGESGTPGPNDALTDVMGLRVGHARVSGAYALSGSTVVLGPEGGFVAAVDVRGGGPGTRETDALDPRNLVRRTDAIVLTGGSAYGLDAASGVVGWLEEQRRGFRIGLDPAQVVPVVPAACLFDLGRGGDWRSRPDAATGRAAVVAAAGTAALAPVEQGSVGAGTGAVVGGLKGGVGTASTRLPSGATVAALVVVNAVGAAVDPLTGALYGEYFQGRVTYPGEDVHQEALRRGQEARAESARRHAASVRPPLNTTLAVVATDAELTRAQAQKLAGTTHDGFARALRPVHQLTDGDTVFALSTGALPLLTGEQDPVFAAQLTAAALNEVLAAGADTVTRAIVQAVRAAEGVDGPGGVFPAYRDLYPGSV